MKTKIEIDNSRLIERMKRYEEVTGKQISATMRRGARLLAVNMAFSTPPYGTTKAVGMNAGDTKPKKLGEQATQNDILRVFTPGSPMKTRHGRVTRSFSEDVENYMTRNVRLKKAILAAIRAADVAKLQTILKNVPGYARYTVHSTVDASLHKRTRNAYGRVRKGWKSRDIVVGNALKDYISEKQDLVGLTKAAWASAALKVNADVKDALSGIPAWVKRHISAVPSAVIDRSGSMAPLVTMKSQLPWADKATRDADKKEAIRICREKFFNSMCREIKAALKAEQMVTPTT